LSVDFGNISLTILEIEAKSFPNSPAPVLIRFSKKPPSWVKKPFMSLPLKTLEISVLFWVGAVPCWFVKGEVIPPEISVVSPLSARRVIGGNIIVNINAIRKNNWKFLLIFFI